MAGPVAVTTSASAAEWEIASSPVIVQLKGRKRTTLEVTRADVSKWLGEVHDAIGELRAAGEDLDLFEQVSKFRIVRSIKCLQRIRSSARGLILEINELAFTHREVLKLTLRHGLSTHPGLWEGVRGVLEDLRYLLRLDSKKLNAVLQAFSNQEPNGLDVNNFDDVIRFTKREGEVNSRAAHKVMDYVKETYPLFGDVIKGLQRDNEVKAKLEQLLEAIGMEKVKPKPVAEFLAEISQLFWEYRALRPMDGYLRDMASKMPTAKNVAALMMRTHFTIEAVKDAIMSEIEQLVRSGQVELKVIDDPEQEVAPGDILYSEPGSAWIYLGVNDRKEHQFEGFGSAISYMTPVYNLTAKKLLLPTR
jgi:hypothetical protein